MLPLFAAKLMKFQRDDRPFAGMIRFHLRQRPDILKRVGLPIQK